MNPLAAIPNDPLTEADEQRLALAATDDARQELVMRSLHQAVAYARKVSKGKMPDDELLSLCYAALERAAKNFKPGKQRFFCYSKAYCRGQVYKAWRSLDAVTDAYAHETPKVDAAAEDEPLEPDFQEPAFDQINLKEVWEQIVPIMDKCFSEQERAVLTMRYGSGYTFARIGQLLGISGSAAGDTHDRALKKLRRALGGKRALFK